MEVGHYVQRARTYPSPRTAAVNKAGGARTYMKMETGGVSFGLGAQKNQVILLFETSNRPGLVMINHATAWLVSCGSPGDRCHGYPDVS